MFLERLMRFEMFWYIEFSRDLLNLPQDGSKAAPVGQVMADYPGNVVYCVGTWYLEVTEQDKLWLTTQVM